MSSEERRKNPSAFLRSLFQILQREEVNETICWAPKQNGFVIKNLQKFQETILPQYFKHKKYSSFVRQVHHQQMQLNMYGFHKQRSANNQNCFLHDTFKKSDGLPVDIRRKPQKKKKADGLVDKEEQQKDNWLQIGKQLQVHFPHIICYNKPLLKNNQNQQKNIQIQASKIEYSGSKQSQQVKQQHQMSEQQSQQYISKISLRGIFQNQQQKEQANKRNQMEAQNNQKKNEKQIKNQNRLKNSQKNQQSKYQRQNQTKLSSKQNINEKNQQQNLLRSQEMHTFNSQNTSTFSRNSIQNVNSLTTLCEILIKQNRILQSTHPKIRNVCLQSQKNQIQYKKQQLKLLMRQQSQEECKDKTKKIIEVQRKYLTQTTQMLVQSIFKLKELIQEDNMISTTSIKFNLQK